MGLLQLCAELFHTSDLYKVLCVAKEASDAELRRGYYKLSLQVHPDRAPDDQQATIKFQVLGKVYAVLSDKDQRAVYDEQGVVDEEDSLNQDRNWEEHWRRLFPKITLQDIIDFEKQYKDSEEEKQDLKRLYLQHEGDMDRIMESALCSSHDDEPRVRDILKQAIDAKDVPAYKVFTHESAKKKARRRRKAENEQQEAEELQREMGLNTEDSLVAMIQQRQKSKEKDFNSLISDLEAKYCKKSSKGKRAQSFMIGTDLPAKPSGRQ
ncbi:dnaJ homolog subfamily C member 9 [Ictalurus furcatus]|uniref:dnaJ homolog subfamily C member 9 n=1 Tax=Ictalurus furcatus TaxID=66913 RepID=UPI00235021CE|nr:dnaJ homolog subfamily C member 9 [Ictalurus furcatus]